MINNNHKIEDSELILNHDGSVYHLNLKPEDIADTIITVGDPDRVVAVSQHFDEIELRVQRREFITHTGYLNKKRITVLSTGIGTPSIDIVMNELDALANIDLKTRTIKPNTKSLDIIRIGTSGGLQTHIPIDSFVITEYGLGLESSLNFYPLKNTAYETNILDAFNQHLGEHQSLIRPYVAGVASKFKQIFNNNFIPGITATCGGFYAAQGRVLRTPLAIPDFIERLNTFSYQDQKILNFEMETSAIYGLGKVLNHNCCSLSLVINNRLEKKFSNDIHKAMEKLIQLALECISR